MRFSSMSMSTVERTTTSSSSFLLIIIFFGCTATMSTAFTSPSRIAQLQHQHSLRFHRLQQRQQHSMTATRLLMMMDPVEMMMTTTTATTSTVLGHWHDVASSAASVVEATSSSATAVASSSTGALSSMEAILSTMYTQSSTLQTVVVGEVAHGHSQPFWGPADAYLTAGKSIAPPAQNLIDMGIITASKQGDSINTALSTTADAAAKGGGSAELLTRTIQEEMSKGWKFLDYNTIQIKNLPGQSIQGGYMPGFVDPASTSSSSSNAFSLLAQPETRLYPDYNETPETFVLMIKWASALINVVDKLPLAAFVYALIEFFILRPNLDITKRQIQNESSTTMAESVATTSVRLVVFMVVALLTLLIFG